MSQKNNVGGLVRACACVYIVIVKYFPCIWAVFSSVFHWVVDVFIVNCIECFYVNDEPESKFLYTETIKLYCKPVLGVWALPRAPTRKTEEDVDRRQNNKNDQTVSSRHCIASSVPRNCCFNCCAEQSQKDNVRSTAVEKQPKQKKSNFLSPAPPPCSWSLLG